MLFCWKFNRLSSSERVLKKWLKFDKIMVTVGWHVFLKIHNVPLLARHGVCCEVSLHGTATTAC